MLTTCHRTTQEIFTVVNVPKMRKRISEGSEATQALCIFAADNRLCLAALELEGLKAFWSMGSRGEPKSPLVASMRESMARFRAADALMRSSRRRWSGWVSGGAGTSLLTRDETAYVSMAR